MTGNPSLEDILAQAQAKLQAKGVEEEQKKTQAVEVDLKKREQAIEVEKSSAGKSETANAGIAQARQKYESAQQEIALIDSKADMLRAAGMEEQLQGLYDQKNAELVTRQQELKDAENQLTASEEQLGKARAESDNIVPPAMAETVTPEQKAAREALEQNAITEDTIRTADKYMDEAFDENNQRNQEKITPLVSKNEELSLNLGSQIEQSDEFLYLRKRFPNISEVLVALRVELELKRMDELDLKNALRDREKDNKNIQGLTKVLEKNGFFQRPDVIEMLKQGEEYWEIKHGKQYVERRKTETRLKEIKE